MTDSASRPRIYVAGPISKGDVQANVRAGIAAGLRLLTAGFAPMIPHLSMLAEPDALAGTPRYEDWLEHDLAWIEVADALVRLPGESSGADREVAHALLHNVPVLYPHPGAPFDDLLCDLKLIFTDAPA